MADIVTPRRTAVAKQKLLKQIANQKFLVEGYKLEQMELIDRIETSKTNQAASEKAIAELEAKLMEEHGDG